MRKATALFQSWSKNMVRYGLSTGLGRLYSNQVETATLYQLGNFLFPAGQVDRDLWQDYTSQYGLAEKIIISEDFSWREFLDSQSELQPFTRYAFSDKIDFDTEALEKWQSNLPAGFQLCPIEEDSYLALAEEVWSQDLQGDFVDFAHFQVAGGFGFVLYLEEEVAAAVSTGLVYEKAIEIEIATKPVYQRKGLAKVLGARMILEAQKRSLIPLWDAHNVASMKVAESLGYRFLGAYPAYELKETFWKG